MKRVALYDAKNHLSALVAEVEETGAEIVITRHGAPVARLAPLHAGAGPSDRKALGEYLLAQLKEQAARNPRALEKLSWEELKADMDQDR